MTGKKIFEITVFKKTPLVKTEEFLFGIE